VRREGRGILQEGDGKVNCSYQALPCGGRDLHRTRDLVFPMVRFGRMYEGDHVHLVFRKPVAEFHALTTEVLIVPQRHNSCDYNPSPPGQRVIYSANSIMCVQSRRCRNRCAILVERRLFRSRRRAERPFQVICYLSAVMRRRASSSDMCCKAIK
jgi:hypothetical protein